MPDVSGIDKIFDYLVPDELHERLTVGARVRVVLNGRRVGGWVTDIAPHGERDQHVALDRLSPIVSLSGLGVEADVVVLTQWVSKKWWGPWRAVLASASAPRVRERPAHSRRGDGVTSTADSVTEAAEGLWSSGGGLLCVPPLASSLSCVAAAAQHGPVLVICPTIRMAIAGAAALRRRGLSTALMPDDWDNARAGVDVVIGTRSAVFAPVADLSSIVVIDEHDEALHEERVPTWNAVEVARERARRSSVPFYSTSPVPSVASLFASRSAAIWVHSEREWPRIDVMNLDDVPVRGSLLSSALLQAIAHPTHSTVCVLNTKGKARLLACKSCRDIQRCSECLSLLSQGDDGMLTCLRCSRECGSVCQKCGRSSFVVLRGGVTQLRTQLEANGASEIVEVTSDSDDNWTHGRIFIGTEAVLYRIPSTDTVVFADIDRDLGAARMSAGSEVLALVARAARLVGANGRIIIQTRQPDHPVMVALSAQSVSQGIRTYVEADLAQRQALSLPPVTRIVRVALPSGYSINDEMIAGDVLMAREEEAVLLRSSSDVSLDATLKNLRESFGVSMRVYADPRRI